MSRGVLFYVALGGALGSVVRALLSTGVLWLAGPPAGAGIALGTLAVNVSGSFLIGLYAALTGPDGRWRHGPEIRHLVMTGFCGGLTTFSIFSLEIFAMLVEGLLAAAGLIVALSLLLWLLAAWAGNGVGLWLNRRASR